MKRMLCLIGALTLSACAIGGGSGLWPEIEPHTSGMLPVSDIHRIYYEQCGNPDGVPVFVLHGGPGGSCSPYMRRFFDPDKFNIVLHDQRGAGRSKPFAEIRGNTTWDLVSDIEKLRQQLGVDRMVLLGGSWGATLALAYAETHPGRVSGMVLRGVFTATRDEIDFFYHGGARANFPDIYEKFISGLPDPDSDNIPQQLFTLLQNPDPAQRARYSRLWAEYEIKISRLHFPDRELEAVLENFDPYAFALLENYYMANGCFFDDGQLWRDINRIAHIPCVIVNGRYDMVCPPVTAHRLHQRLPRSRLVIAESSGHWMGETAVEKALLEAVKEYESLGEE